MGRAVFAHVYPIDIIIIAPSARHERIVRRSAACALLAPFVLASCLTTAWAAPASVYLNNTPKCEGSPSPTHS